MIEPEMQKYLINKEVEEYWERKGKYLYEERLNSRNVAPYRAAPHVEFIMEIS